MKQGMEIFNAVSHLFFPHICPGCGSDLLQDHELICIRCSRELPVTGFAAFADNPTEKIFWGRVPLLAATSLYYFTKQSALQQLLHQLKYNGKKEVGIFLGRLLGEALQFAPRFEPIDALVPLPLYASREKKRGYNQAKLICDGIAEVMNIPVWDKVVARRQATATQTHKSRTERWQNMNSNFVLTGNGDLDNRHVLLVDDVVTTGATLEACARALLEANNTRVSVATLAYTNL